MVSRGSYRPSTDAPIGWNPPRVPQRLPRQSSTQSAWGLADLCGPGFGVPIGFWGCPEFRAKSCMRRSEFIDVVAAAAPHLTPNILCTKSIPYRYCVYNNTEYINSNHHHLNNAPTCRYISFQRHPIGLRAPSTPRRAIYRLAQRGGQIGHGTAMIRPCHVCIGEYTPVLYVGTVGIPRLGADVSIRSRSAYGTPRQTQ